MYACILVFCVPIYHLVNTETSLKRFLSLEHCIPEEEKEKIYTVKSKDFLQNLIVY